MSLSQSHPSTPGPPHFPPSARFQVSQPITTTGLTGDTYPSPTLEEASRWTSRTKNWKCVPAQLHQHQHWISGCQTELARDNAGHSHPNKHTLTKPSARPAQPAAAPPPLRPSVPSHPPPLPQHQ
ncbi:hypothetical protein CSAL01_08813 [Colletotrichum salicis]|uniref:Uncharacterized protein n=1 Tax=Colletotrichum salicis TaxID=1209931 RepID=A0A135UVD8_9PEZI|nr:hypothetical protein CSAL01_08813 [Colletotrichum salicis]